MEKRYEEAEKRIMSFSEIEDNKMYGFGGFLNQKSKLKESVKIVKDIKLLEYGYYEIFPNDNGELFFECFDTDMKFVFLTLNIYTKLMNISVCHDSLEHLNLHDTNFQFDFSGSVTDYTENKNGFKYLMSNLRSDLEWIAEVEHRV